MAIGPWTAPLPPWVAFYVFVGVSLTLLLVSGRLLASNFQDPLDRAFCYFAMLVGLPVFVLLWNAQAHVLIVFAVVLILAGLMRCQQDPASARRYLRWIQLGLLIALLSKPIVLLMLPALIALPETRRKVLLPVAVYAAVSLLFLLVPRLNPGSYNGVHWLFMISGSLEVKPLGSFAFFGRDDFTGEASIYSLPMLLYRTYGAAVLPLAKLPLVPVAVMSVAPFLLSNRRRRICAATVAVALCVLSFFFCYCIVWEYNYVTLMPILPLLLWLCRQERTPWLRRLLMGSLLVSLTVFLPTPVALDMAHPNRFWVAAAIERLTAVLAAYLGLLVYGIASFCRAWGGWRSAVRRTAHGAWAPLGLGAALCALLGGVLATALLTLPGRMLRSPDQWTDETWTTHFENVLSRPGVAPEVALDAPKAARLYGPARATRCPGTPAPGDEHQRPFGLAVQCLGQHLLLAGPV